jgi:cytochrome c-type biogenesis protein CcmE
MKAKHQRLGLAIAALVAITGSGLLAMSALKDQAAYFYSPGDLEKADVKPGQAIRLGGMVADKSIKREGDGLTINFMVTDGKAQTPVRFKGITPDLFKENSGVVAEGKMGADGVFVADNILAKHDERYMPPQLDGKMHKTGEVK